MWHRRGGLTAAVILVLVAAPALARGERALDLPDVWGGGALFAFSGFDGETSSQHSFVGCTLADRRGIHFRVGDGVSIYLRATAGRRTIDGTPERAFLDPDDLVLGGDVIFSDLALTERHRVLLRLICRDRSSVLGEVAAVTLGSPVDVAWVIEAPGQRAELGPRWVVVRSGGAWFAVAGTGAQPDGSDQEVLIARRLEQPGDRFKFAWAYSPTSGADALAAARRALRSDVLALYRKRLDFLTSAPAPKSDRNVVRRTYHKCVSVMKVNSLSPEGEFENRWTTPDRWPHAHMWLWDSAFHAIGLRHISARWARDALLAVLSRQRDDGFIPHRMAPDGSRSGITQPPILAWAAWRVHERSPDRAFLNSCYPRLAALIEWHLAHSDRNRNHLYEWQDSDASGMDNSPRFERGAHDAVDLSAYLANDMEYLARIAEALGNLDAAAQWRAQREKVAQQINSLMWDPGAAFYYDLDAQGQRIPLKTEAGFCPLFAGVCTGEQARALRQHLREPAEFWTPLPVPSVAADEDSFSDDMWRGPVWVNYNYMIIEGLRHYQFDEDADALCQKTIDAVARWWEIDGVIYEFYDSADAVSPSALHRKGKVGTCIKDYHWSAALFVDLVLTGGRPIKR